MVTVLTQLRVLMVLLQQPAIAQIEVTPATAEIRVGETVQLAARALDAAGARVAGALIFWLANEQGSVDRTGLVTAGYPGTVRVTVVGVVPGRHGQVFGEAVVTVRPKPPARIEFTPAPTQLIAGVRLSLTATAYGARGDPQGDAITFTSSDPRVVRVTADGRLRAVAPGRATVTASAGAASTRLAIDVLPNTVARLAIEPATASVRTGDVVRFRVSARDARGRPVSGVVAAYSLVAASDGNQVAQIYADGAFVAEAPGTYTVTAAVGTRSADAVIRVEPRRATRGIAVLAHLPLPLRNSEVWLHPIAACAYLGTYGDRVYAIDVTDPAHPRIADSIVANARLINDVTTTADGRYGVFTREGASDRRNGIVIFDATDPCHPNPVAEYTRTVSGGVHSTHIDGTHVYVTDDATGSLRVVSIADPLHPEEVARWQPAHVAAGRYLHDVRVQDGLAYLSYWNDGVIVLDVGNGLRGGSPDHPQFVSQYRYDLDATYARIARLFGPGFTRGTHTAWRAGQYLFVGDEAYPARPYPGLRGGLGLTFGRLHVLDVSELEHPREVAWYEPPDGGVHNFWIAGDTLYLGNYQGGARVLDISGELRGDLLRQGREISWLPTADTTGPLPSRPYAWGAVARDGVIYVSDVNSGLWILRLEH